MPRPEPPHAVVTHDGVATKLLLRQGAPIDKTPITGLDQVVTVGDTAQRSDQRTPQVIWSDQRGGGGVRKHTETEGNTGYRDSQVDARFGLLTLTPDYSGAHAHGANTGVMGFVEYLDESGVLLIVWGWLANATTSARRFDGTSTWTTITTGGTGIKNLTGFAYFNGRYCFATTEAASGLHTSTDAATWADGSKAKSCVGLAVHDNKLWTFNATDNTLDFATDPTAAHGSWGTSAVLYLHPKEVVRQVVTWRDPDGREAIYLVTTRRILWYDEDADTFLDFDNLARRTGGAAPATFYPRLVAALSDGNAYATLYNSDTSAPKRTEVVQFSGVASPLRPGRDFGAAGFMVPAFRMLVDDGAFLYGIGALGSSGKVMARGETGGWTTYHYDVGTPLVGGGYGAGKIFLLDATYLRIPQMGSADHPLDSDALRSYPSGVSQRHDYAFTDGGRPNQPMQDLWVVVNCLDQSDPERLPGLAEGTSVGVGYLVDGDTVPTFLTPALDHTDSFPAIRAIDGGDGVLAKQIRPVLVLSTADGNYSPIVESLGVAFIRREEPRYAYTLVADLRDMEKKALYASLDRGELLARVEAWTQPGAVVRLDFAGGDWASDPATAVTVPNATVQYRASADPHTGVQQLTLVFSDVTPPASG